MTSQRVIYFSEVLPVLRKGLRPSVLLGAGLFCLIGLFLLLGVTPKFTATATFQKRKMEKERLGVESMLRELRQGPSETSAQVVMKSRGVLEHVVSKMGLQMEVKGWTLRDVTYQGDVSHTFFLRKEGDQTFSLLDPRKRVLCSGQFGDLCSWGNLSFIVLEGDKCAKASVAPLRGCVGTLKKALKVKPRLKEPSFLDLSYSDVDRSVAIGVLNAVMDGYRQFLKKEHEAFAAKQLLYLRERQEELALLVDAALSEEVAYHRDENPVEELMVPRNRYLAEREELDLFAKQIEGEPKLLASRETPWQEALYADEPLDLETVQALISKTGHESERIQGQIDELTSLLEKALDPQFSLVAFSEFLTPPVAKEVHDLEMKVGGAYTAKEREQMRATLNERRSFLQESLRHRIEVAKLEKASREKAMRRLQSHAAVLVAKKRGHLDEKLDEIASKMSGIPEKKRRDNLIKMKKDLAMQTMEAITRLSETKVIDHQLFDVASGPLEKADAPLVMASRHIFLYSSMGGMTGCALSLIFFLVHAVLTGLPVSIRLLKDRGYAVQPKNEETPLRLLLSIGEGEVVSLVNTKLGCELVELLKKNGRNPHRISVDSFLHHSTNERIAGWKSEYGCILLDCDESLQSVQALSTLPVADRFIVDATGQSEEALDPYPPKRTLCLIES